MAAGMYSYGSEARELEYDASLEAQRRREEARNAKRQKALAESKRRRAIRKNAIKALLVMTAILAVIMIREAQIDMLCGKISAMEKTKENLDAIVTEKEINLSGSMDLKVIEDIATSKLGMKKPDQSQYVYIKMDKSDSGQILDETKVKKDGIFEKIGKLLEYLY